MNSQSPNIKSPDTTLQARPQLLTKADKVRWYESWTFLIIVCVLLPLAIRSLYYAPFHIPSGSMRSTLLVGDYILVDKDAYGYSRYSFPLGIPLFKGRIHAQGKLPERGDVVVFRPPGQPFTDYIKRVIGLPGDTVEVRESRLYLNGALVERRRIGDYSDPDEEEGRPLPKFLETMQRSDGSYISYETLDSVPNGRLDNTPVYVVPEGHYFMMGDNRDHSADSRTDLVGFVPYENLVGRAEKVLFSTSDSLWRFWTWGEAFRGERMWTQIQKFPIEPKSSNSIPAKADGKPSQ